MALAAGDEAEAVGAQGGRRPPPALEAEHGPRSGLDAVPSIRSRVPTRRGRFCRRSLPASPCTPAETRDVQRLHAGGNSTVGCGQARLPSGLMSRARAMREAAG